MSKKTTLRQAVNANWPTGAAWNIAPGGDTEKLLNGIADAQEPSKSFLSNLANVRDPWLTGFLDDLEKEYGILKNAFSGFILDTTLYPVADQAGKTEKITIDGGAEQTVTFKTGTKTIDSVIEQLSTVLTGCLVEKISNHIKITSKSTGPASSVSIGSGTCDLIWGTPIAGVGMTERERRTQLAQLVYASRSSGSKSYLQARLHEAGFTDLFVYDNDPAVNPNGLIFSPAGTMCGLPTAICGNSSAFCGASNKGEFVVNGDVYNQSIAFTTSCGAGYSVCGNAGAVAGSFIESRELITYRAPDPTDETPPPIHALIDPDMETGYPAADWDTQTSKNLLPDGSMEDVATAWFTATNSATLTKETTDPKVGLKHLRVAYNAVNAPAARCVIGLQDGVEYTITGWYRAQATVSKAQVLCGSTVICETGSPLWFSFSETFTATSPYLYLACNASGVANYADFDGIKLTSVDSRVTSTLLNPQHGLRSLEIESINLCKDGNMQLAGVTNWTATNSATLTKDSSSFHSGTLSLKISRNGVNDPGASQLVFSVFPHARVFRISGWAQSDGSVLPQVSAGSYTKTWTGKLSTSWQYFCIDNVITGSALYLKALAKTGTGFCRFDDINITEMLNVLGDGDNLQSANDVIRDGDMAQAGASFWIPGNGAVLSKQLDADNNRCLRISYSGTFGANCKQVVMTVGQRYTLKAKIRGDGVNSFLRVYDGGTLLHTSKVANDWQYLKVDFVATYSYLVFYNWYAGSYVEISEVSLVDNNSATVAYSSLNALLSKGGGRSVVIGDSLSYGYPSGEYPYSKNISFLSENTEVLNYAISGATLKGIVQHELLKATGQLYFDFKKDWWPWEAGNNAALSVVNNKLQIARDGLASPRAECRWLERGETYRVTAVLNSGSGGIVSPVIVDSGIGAIWSGTSSKAEQQCDVTFVAKGIICFIYAANAVYDGDYVECSEFKIEKTNKKGVSFNDVFFMGGVNDLGTGSTVAQVKDRISHLWKQCVTAKKNVVTLQLLPWNSTQENKAKAQELNAWIEQSAPSTVVDTRSLGDSNFDILPVYCLDGLHLTSYGYAELGRLVFNASKPSARALIVKNISTNGYAFETILTLNRTYSITGRARSDGVSIPRILQGGRALWDGNNSTDWQYFDFEFIASRTELWLMTQGAAGAITEWDYVHLQPVDVPEQQPPAAIHTPIEQHQTYYLTGYARSDGMRKPTVRDGERVVWTGTTSTSWQYFEVEFFSESTSMVLSQVELAGRAGWDNFGFWKRTGSGNWNLIFFVGGTVTRNAKGEIININFVDIKTELRKSLIKIILRHKPLQTWAALAAHYV